MRFPRPDMFMHWRHQLTVGLVAILLLGGCASDQPTPSGQKNTVISRHAFRGKLIGFEIGDYIHAVVRDRAGKSRSFFIGEPGLSYYLALRESETLGLEYEIADTFIEEAGGIMRIERLTSATDGRLDAREWWETQRRTHTLNELLAKYQPLIDRYSISHYANGTLGAPKVLEGKWRLTGKSHCAQICAMDAEEAGRLKGVVIAYSATAFSNGRDARSSPQFLRRGLTAESFLGEYRFKAETLGFGDRVIEEFSLRCKDTRAGGANLGATVLVKDERTLIVPWDGVFFEARKQ